MILWSAAAMVVMLCRVIVEEVKGIRYCRDLFPQHPQYLIVLKLVSLMPQKCFF